VLLTADRPAGAGAATPDHASDGRLEAWEILDLGFTADLAVLSACKTARGKFGWGEGIIGLSWSMFAAGASTAIVSQWEVDSASTTSLMIGFHRRLLGKTAAGAPEALRQAALTLLRNPAYRHPFYWAGFIAVGAR
jgi:CHAT domain-containing protein